MGVGLVYRACVMVLWLFSFVFVGYVRGVIGLGYGCFTLSFSQSLLPEQKQVVHRSCVISREDCNLLSRLTVPVNAFPET